MNSLSPPSQTVFLRKLVLLETENARLHSENEDLKKQLAESEIKLKYLDWSPYESEGPIIEPSQPKIGFI